MGVVRRAGEADLDDLLVLVQAFCRADHHDYDEARVRAGLEPMLAGDDLGQVWVLDGPGGPAGYAIVTWSWSLESGGRDCILDEIYVEPTGAGYGSLLLRHALHAARAAGALAVFLETEAHNGPARRFYARHGFAVEDSVWMSAPLR